MYMRFFGLKQEPFSLAPDPRYLYMSKRHREALAHLLYGVGGGGGFVLLSGEIGAGKTTVCRCFLEQIPKRCNVAYIFNPKLTVIELLKSICDEFRVPYAVPRGTAPTVKSYVDPLNEFLLKTHAVGQNNVLIIDEAQMLSVDVLEQLRLLTNLETSERKLLQIVLIGQPELRAMLERPDLEQLAQRVIARFHLKALSTKETEHYIRHRLSVAGMTRQIPFDKHALQRVHEIARGVPRRINLLCDRAMLGAYAHGRQAIDAQTVEKAAREVFGKSERIEPDHSRVGSRPGMGLVAFTAVALLALVAFALFGVWRRATTPELSTVVPAASAAIVTGATGVNAASRPAALAAASAGSSARSSIGASSAVVTPATAASPAATTNPRTLVASQPLVSVPPSPAAVSVARPAEGAAATAAAATASMPLDGPALQAELKAIGRSERVAWAELAPMWQVAADGPDVCDAAARQQVRCFKFPTTLAVIRALGRPGFMTVRDDAGRALRVLLVGLGDDRAILRDGERLLTVQLAALGKSWQGEFATMWKTPPGYAGALADGTSGPLVDRLAAQLARLANEPPPPATGATFDAALRAKVARFQSANGLGPVGKPGPTTFMQLNRATGVDEPRLVATTTTTR